MTHRRGEPSGKRRRHLRGKIAARDGWSCFYCGTPFAFPGAATLDHLVPFEAFPTWSQANLVLACDACNHAKGNALPQTFLRPVRYASGLRTSRWGHVRAAVHELYAAVRMPAVRVSVRGRETPFEPVRETADSVSRSAVRSVSRSAVRSVSRSAVRSVSRSAVRRPLYGCPSGRTRGRLSRPRQAGGVAA